MKKLEGASPDAPKIFRQRRSAALQKTTRYSLLAAVLACQEPRPPTSFRPPSLVPRPFRFCPVSLVPCPALSWRSFMGCCTLQSGAVVA
jgi:hypothetical protein